MPDTIEVTLHGKSKDDLVKTSVLISMSLLLLGCMNDESKVTDPGIPLLERVERIDIVIGENQFRSISDRSTIDASLTLLREDLSGWIYPGPSRTDEESIVGAFIGKTREENVTLIIYPRAIFIGGFHAGGEAAASAETVARLKAILQVGS